MEGFKKYIIILGATFLALWFISIMIYWEVIGDYIAQSINGIYNSGVSILVTIIVFLIIISMIIGMIRG